MVRRLPSKGELPSLRHVDGNCHDDPREYDDIPDEFTVTRHGFEGADGSTHRAWHRYRRIDDRAFIVKLGASTYGVELREDGTVREVPLSRGATRARDDMDATDVEAGREFVRRHLADEVGGRFSPGSDRSACSIRRLIDRFASYMRGGEATR